MVAMNFLLFAVPSILLGLLTAPGTCELTLVTFGALLPRKRPLPSRANAIHHLAVVIPAHNEARVIGRCLVSLTSCSMPGSVQTDLLVVADNCSDDTAEIARRFGVRVLVRTDPIRRGKGFALQHAFERLLAESVDAVLVVDADTVVESNLLIEIVGWLNSGADGVQARYLVLNPKASMRTRIMNVALMAFNVLRPRGRERCGLSAGILGNGFALRSSTLEAVAYRAESIVEDLEYHLQLVRSGRRVWFADRTCVRAEMPMRKDTAVTQRARWDGGRLGMAVRTLPRMIHEIAKGNSSLVEPLFELMLLPLAFHTSMLLAALAIPYRLGRWWALTSLSVVVAHVLTALVVGGGGINDVAALAAAPWYVAWKLTVLPDIFRAAQRDARWIRTERTGES